MSKDPFEDLTKMKLPTIFEGGQKSSVSNFCVNEVSRVIKTGFSLGRNVQARAVRGQLKDMGYDPITIDNVVNAIKAGQPYEGILAAADEARAARAKANELRRNPPPIHGSAAWATISELTEAEFLFSEKPKTGAGIDLGRVSNEYLYWQGESHLLTVAPTRTGKGTMQIIPNLLQYKGSAVVLDPKGELAAITADWRREHVGPVYIINPFELAPFGKETAAVNSLDQVNNAQDALKLAEMIYPRTNDDKQKFFDNEAIGFLSGVIEFVARYAPEGWRNMGYIRDILSANDDKFESLVEAMSDPGMPASIRNSARSIFTKNSDVSIPRLFDSMNQHLRIWDSEGLRRATERSDFNFKDLKDETATVYLVLPFDELTTYSTYVQMIFAMALDAMLADQSKPEIPVLFILDEFLGLEADDRFVSALRTHASAGCRLWFFLQDLPTLEQKYPTTWKSFFQAEVKTFFGTDDPHTADLISNYLGDRTIVYDLPSTSPSVGGQAASYSISENIQLTGRPLLKPDEVIRQLASLKLAEPRPAINFIRGVPPTVAYIAPYFANAHYQQLASPIKPERE